MCAFTITEINRKTNIVILHAGDQKITGTITKIERAGICLQYTIGVRGAPPIVLTTEPSLTRLEPGVRHESIPHM